MVVLLVLMTSAMYAKDEDVLRPKGRSGSGGSSSSSSSSSSKMNMMWGLEAGLNFNMFSQKLNRDNAIPTSPEDVLAEGFGISPLIGIIGDIPLTNTVALHLRLDYDAKSYSNSLSSTIDATSPNGIFEMTVLSEYKASVAYLNIAPSIRFNVSPEVFGSIGLSFQSKITEFSREDKVTDNDDNPNSFLAIDYTNSSGQFSEISRTVSAVTNFLPSIIPPSSEYASSRVGIELGVGYMYKYSPTVYIVPQLGYQLMFTPTNDNLSYADISRTPSQRFSTITTADPMLHSIQATVGVWFSLP